MAQCAEVFVPGRRPGGPADRAIAARLCRVLLNQQPTGPAALDAALRTDGGGAAACLRAPHDLVFFWQEQQRYGTSLSDEFSPAQMQARFVVAGQLLVLRRRIGTARFLAELEAAGIDWTALPREENLLTEPTSDHDPQLARLMCRMMEGQQDQARISTETHSHATQLMALLDLLKTLDKALDAQGVALGELLSLPGLAEAGQRVGVKTLIDRAEARDRAIAALSSDLARLCRMQEAASQSLVRIEDLQAQMAVGLFEDPDAGPNPS